MSKHQPKKLNESSDLINQLISDTLSNGINVINLIPVLSNKAEIAAALIGLRYPFEQLILNSLKHTENSQNEIEQLFFWVKEPMDYTDPDFNQNILKICQYYQIMPKCSVEFVDGQAKIQLYTIEAIIQKTLDVENLGEWIKSSFWVIFTDESSEILKIYKANEYTIVCEPQTNLGRLAKQLKINHVLEELDIFRLV